MKAAMRSHLAPAGAAALLVLCLFTSSATGGLAGGPARAVTAGITIYVDDDAPNDAGPNDPNVSDPLEDGSAEHPFDRVQEALDVALPVDLVQILPGAYLEDLVAPRESYTIRGSGRAATTLGPAAAGRFDLDGTCPALSLGALTLHDLRLTLDPYACARLVLEEVDLVRSSLVVSHGRDYGDCLVRMRDVGMTGSSLLVDWVGGTVFAEIEDLSATGGWFSFGAINSARLDLTLRNILAPDLVLSAYESWFSGPGSFITVNDSTIGGIITYLENGPPDMTLDVNNVRFTGRGIYRFTSSEGETTIVRDSVFENGGIRIVNPGCRHDCQDAEDNALITGSVFQNAGIDYEAGRTYEAWIPGQDRFSLEVDGNRFRRGGIRALYPSPTRRSCRLADQGRRPH